MIINILGMNIFSAMTVDQYMRISVIIDCQKILTDSNSHLGVVALGVMLIFQVFGHFQHNPGKKYWQYFQSCTAPRPPRVNVEYVCGKATCIPQHPTLIWGRGRGCMGCTAHDVFSSSYIQVRCQAFRKLPIYLFPDCLENEISLS